MRSRFMELKKNRLATALNMAVGQGFEPREPLGSTVFKTAAFDHSASPPKLFRLRSSEATHYSDAASAIKLQRPHFQRLSHPALQ